MKKRLAAIMMSLALVLLMASCGEQMTPSDVADNYMQTQKEYVTSAVNDIKNGTGGALEETMGITSEELSELSDEAKDSLSQVFNKMRQFDYEVVNESATEDTATVTVRITTFDFGKQLEEAMSDIVANAFGYAFSGMSDEEMESKLIEDFAAKLAEAKKNYTQDVDITLNMNEEGVWEVDEDNDELVNAITGGMMDAMINSMDSMFSEYESMF